jgi:hypothetical protein
MLLIRTNGRRHCQMVCHSWPIHGYIPSELRVSERPDIGFILAAYSAVRLAYGHFYSARCPAPGTATRLPVGRCQTDAPRLPVRTYDQVRQTGVRVRAEPQGSSRPVSQPHPCRRRQDTVTLPHRRTADLAQQQIDAGRRFRSHVDALWEACEQWADGQLADTPASSEEAKKRGSKRISHTKSPRRSGPS